MWWDGLRASQDDRDLVDPFGDSLDEDLKVDTEHPNALFLGRITWNSMRELLYRVHDPKVANDLLQSIIAEGSYPREFDFRIEDDPAWELAQWHLNACRGQ